MFSNDLGFNPFDKGNDGYGQYVASKGLGSKFLNSFNWKNEIYCYNGDPRKKISSMNHTSDFMEAYHANRDNGADFYFYVNGGRKLFHIEQFTCCFCDMDAGRDDKGQYLKPSVVMEKKKKFLEQINNFPVKPSWVVDTRNGYQCYWIFDDQSRQLVGKNKTYWNGLQKKLVNYFGGDPRAIKANQIYRVPYTWWRKGWEGKAPYFTSILPGSSGDPINVADLQFALTGQSTNIVIDPAKCSDEWYKGYAKAYKQADANSLPVPEDVAAKILQDMCGQRNSQKSVDMNLNAVPLTVGNVEGVTLTYHKPISEQTWASYSSDHKLYGDANPVVPGEVTQGGCLNLTVEQTKLLKTVVDYLNQASTALYFSNNRFLSSAAKDLSSQLSDQFCIG
jgi:hypothetical protein